ncbi:MAG: hypothetical protein KAJ24_06575 [Candidatus Aenigmarchaeota archaeon]|nr:hypothetical protein [Candidatus Aenigmarchaeota archaeon]
MDDDETKTQYYEKPISGAHPDGFCPESGKDFVLIYVPEELHHPDGFYRCSQCGALFDK